MSNPSQYNNPNNPSRPLLRLNDASDQLYASNANNFNLAFVQKTGGEVYIRKALTPENNECLTRKGMFCSVSRNIIVPE